MLCPSLFPSCLLLGLLVVPSFAAPNKKSTLTARAPNPSSTACGDIVRSSDDIFDASKAYDCLSSVPFNTAVARQFVQYYIDTVQFQSTLDYLKLPPATYLQPGIDILEALNQLQANIDAGLFTSEYDFETALQRLIYAAHDSHLSVVAGILSAFTFGAPYDIASVSTDGIQLPKLYLGDDLFYSQYEDWSPSAISKINGQDAVLFVRNFAAENAIGGLEPHADFNQMMTSPALDIQTISNVWLGGATFYPGETITFLLENGTQIGPTPWQAVYAGPTDTGPIETGADFYNFFVLDTYPANYIPPSDDDSNDDDDDDDDDDNYVPSTSWDNPAYPYTPDIAQLDLGSYGGGSLSGYFLRNSSIAVLSMPSFYESGIAIGTFSNTVKDFLSQSKKIGMKKVVIDLQQNSGGDIFLAWDTFKQFFPTVDPFGGSRMRAYSAADTIGQAITGHFQGLPETDPNYARLIPSEWVSSVRVDADTNQNFTSWAQFFGPYQDDDKSFTSTQRYDTNNALFTTLSSGNPNQIFEIYGSTDRPANASQPYAAEDIIILSDSLCASTCSLFMEMMHTDVGVRTVVAGGIPAFGPMQAPGLTRGARGYDVLNILDPNIKYAQSLLNQAGDTAGSQSLPNRSAVKLSISSAEINLRDQVRQGGDVPLQFLFEAADCRIFFTAETFYNFTALWQYAADAIWNKPQLCVQNSTGHSNTNITRTEAPPTAVSASPNPPAAQAGLGSIIMNMLADTSHNEMPIQDSLLAVTDKSCEGKPCSPRPSACLRSEYVCYTPVCTPIATPYLVKTCLVQPGTNQGCFDGGTCVAMKPASSTALRVAFPAQNPTKPSVQPKQVGYCHPPLNLGCRPRELSSDVVAGAVDPGAPFAS